MPCYGPDGPGNTRSDIAERRLSEVINDLNKATRAACEMGKIIRKLRMEDALLTPLTRRWLKEHEKLDEKRKVK